MRIRLSQAMLVLLPMCLQPAHADECQIVRQDVFIPQNKKVLLATSSRDTNKKHSVVIF